MDVYPDCHISWHLAQVKVIKEFVFGSLMHQVLKTFFSVFYGQVAYMSSVLVQWYFFFFLISGTNGIPDLNF